MHVREQSGRVTIYGEGGNVLALLERDDIRNLYTQP
jgi:hypothetical protein